MISRVQQNSPVDAAVVLLRPDGLTCPSSVQWCWLSRSHDCRGRAARRLMRACLEMWANGTLVFEPLVNLGNRASTWRDGRNAFFIDGWCDHCVTRPRLIGRQLGILSPEFTDVV